MEKFLSQFNGIYKAPHHKVGKTAWEDNNCTPNGPIMGNGDMHVVLLGDCRCQEYFISKSDMWSDEDAARNVRAVTTGGLTIRPEKMESISDFYQEQGLWNANIHAVSEAGFCTDAFVSAQNNILFLTIRNLTEYPLTLYADLWTKDDDETMPACSDTSGQILWAARETSSQPRGNGEPARWITYSALAAVFDREILIQDRISTGKVSASFQLKERESIQIAVFLNGGKNDSFAVQSVIQTARNFTWEQFPVLRDTHESWWHTFWNKSNVRLYDQTLERFYYGALYLLACVNRSNAIPAGQYPFCISDDPAWAGDYHMDQEYLGQNEAFFSGNRPELSGGIFAPLLDFMETGRAYAKEKMSVVHPDFSNPRKGILYPVGLGPWGVDSTIHDNDGEPWIGQMVSDASYTGMLFIWQYEYFQDIEWLRNVAYPYICEIADFWTSHIHLIEEFDKSGRFSTYGATWEESYGKNPITDIGLIKTWLQHAVEYSKLLDIDEEKRPEWEAILNNLPAYPTVLQDGKEVFCEHAGASSYRGGCDLQAIYPVEAISPLTDPELIPVAHHTLDLEMEHIGAKTQEGSTKPFHSAVCAARMGYPVHKTVSALKSGMLEIPVSTWMGLRENGTIGGLHYNSEFMEFINSSLLQSSNGIIRVFPNWYKDKQASFYHLRAKGAFLVSAAQDENGKLLSLSIESVKGGPCTLELPSGWILIYNGKKVPVKTERLSENIEICHFDTIEDGVYIAELENKYPD